MKYIDSVLTGLVGGLVAILIMQLWIKEQPEYISITLMRQYYKEAQSKYVKGNISENEYLMEIKDIEKIIEKGDSEYVKVRKDEIYGLIKGN